MSKNNLPQYVAVEQDFWENPSPVFGPICGYAAMKEGEDGIWENTPCAHLAFIFVNEVSEFEYMDPEFKERFEKLFPPLDEVEESDDDHWHYDTSKLPAILAEAEYGENLVVFEITSGGMACGPVWFTNLFAFDLEKKTQESDE